ncbi:MAG: nitroreductase family protein [Planctomycetota bacterium]
MSSTADDSRPAPKVNPTTVEILPAMERRWSPYRFEPRVIEDDKLIACLEAARWAASSFNDQPWSWIVARRQDTTDFETMIGCLLEANRGWASRAGALICSVSRQQFAYNQKPNRVALHDLGGAATQMALQATQLGLQTHQMAGINVAQIRGQYRIPDGFEPQTAIAIGYPDLCEPTSPDEIELDDRQNGPRSRHPLAEQVFTGQFRQSATWL